ncbi:MAG TPA: hypothetical protein VFL13_00065 [Candidatus Baltobacteraceae bacterium]|nr:hypothetical protein [Candidatus Baltobacteraceae bacterium]
MPVRVVFRFFFAAAAVFGLLTALPGVAYGDAIPQAAVGHWTGTATVRGSTYPLSIVIRSDGSVLATYGAPLNCSATWSLVAHSGSFMSYSEHVTRAASEKPWPDGASVTLVQDFSGKSIVFRWTLAGDVATAILHRAA